MCSITYAQVSGIPSLIKGFEAPWRKNWSWKQKKEYYRGTWSLVLWQKVDGIQKFSFKATSWGAWNLASQVGDGDEHPEWQRTTRKHPLYDRTRIAFSVCSLLSKVLFLQSGSFSPPWASWDKPCYCLSVFPSTMCFQFWVYYTHNFCIQQHPSLSSGKFKEHF